MLKAAYKAFVKLAELEAEKIKGTNLTTKDPVPNNLPGGKADGMNLGEFNKEQLEKGVDVESEHVKNPLIQVEIAADHLAEKKDDKPPVSPKDNRYYNKLIKYVD